MLQTRTANAKGEPGARERILDGSYELFSRRGIRDVGVDEVIETAGVAKATLYRHFSSKDELALAFLERRGQLWTLEFVEGEGRRRGPAPRGRPPALLDVLPPRVPPGGLRAGSVLKRLPPLGGGHA